MRPGPKPLFSGRIWGKRQSLLRSFCIKPVFFDQNFVVKHLPVSTPARWKEETRRFYSRIGILPQTGSSEAMAVCRNMTTDKALFSRMRGGRILRQRPVVWNLRWISGIRRDREWGSGTLLSASWIGLGRTLLAGWRWRGLMLGRNRTHHGSLSWMGRVWTGRNWSVVYWSGSWEVGARRRDGIGTRPSVHWRRLRAWNWGVVRSHVHWMDRRLEWRRTWVVILRGVRGDIHGVVMVRIGSRNRHMAVPSWAGWMREHTGRSIPTGREVPARDHAGDFRGRQVTNGRVSRQMRRVVRHGAIRERRRGTGIVIGAR
jgi:hypothetical protein